MNYAKLIVKTVKDVCREVVEGCKEMGSARKHVWDVYNFVMRDDSVAFGEVMSKRAYLGTHAVAGDYVASADGEWLSIEFDDTMETFVFPLTVEHYSGETEGVDEDPLVSEFKELLNRRDLTDADFHVFVIAEKVRDILRKRNGENEQEG